MTGWEEINVRFYVDKFDYSEIDGGSGWCLLLKDVDKEGGASTICQRWNHEPTQEEVYDATFAARQGMSFITLHLACERPPRMVEVLMPRIRVNIVDKKETTNATPEDR